MRLIASRSSRRKCLANCVLACKRAESLNRFALRKSGLNCTYKSFTCTVCTRPAVVDVCVCNGLYYTSEGCPDCVSVCVSVHVGRWYCQRSAVHDQTRMQRETAIRGGQCGSPAQRCARDTRLWRSAGFRCSTSMHLTTHDPLRAMHDGSDDGPMAAAEVCEK